MGEERRSQPADYRPAEIEREEEQGHVHTEVAEPYFRIPIHPVRHAQFTNVTNVNFVRGVVFFDFAYVDPYQLGDPENEIAPDGRPIVNVEPIERFALSPEAALSFYEVLGDLLARLELVPPGRHPAIDRRGPG